MPTNDSSAARRWTVEDEDPEQETSGRRCNFWCLGALFLIIGITGLVVVVVLFVIPGCTRLQYGVVMDAGSTHTSMSIYRWAGQKLKGTGEVIEITKCDVQGPGISSYRDKPDGAGQSIQKCLENGRKLVPNDRHGVTPIYLGATAGMRILKSENPTAAKNVFTSVENAFKQSGFKYSDGHVRMVSDQEEGLYAWTAANLLKGTLGQGGSKVETTGTLDMGGASTQIAFETTERKDGGNPDDYQTMRLYGFDFPVFTHSYLCFGQKEVIRRLKAQVILNNLATGRQNYDLPCWHRGNMEEDNVTEIFDNLCTIPLPKELESIKSGKFMFRGTGEVDKCQNEVKQILNLEDCNKKGYKYCLDYTVIPEIKGEFLAISTFYYLADAINATNHNFTQFNKAARDFCATEWKDVLVMPVETQYSSRFCFTALFTVEFLGTIYKFADKWNKVHFTKKIAGVSMGWDLGFMTNATNAIPTEKVSLIKTDLFISLVIVFIVIISLVLILGCRAWTRRNSHSLRKNRNDNPILALCCPKK